MTDERTACPRCRKSTKTVGGLCPNCGYPKAARMPATRPRMPVGNVLDDLEWAAPAIVGLLPGVALIALALLVFDSSILLGVGVVWLALALGAWWVSNSW
jgi:hypothetical protein